jgi:glycosyltransferase involved in cell wall biosynthesis
MKLLLVTQYFWPENFTMNAVAAALADRGVAVEVLTGKPNYPEGRLFSGYKRFDINRECYEGVNIIRMPIVTRGSRSPFRLALNYLSFIFMGVSLGPWLLRGSQPSVVLVYCPSPLLQAIPAILIGRLRKIPVVLYVQDLWPESLEATGYVKNKVMLKFVSQIVKMIYQCADLVLVSSRPFEYAIRRVVNDARIEYLPNSVGKHFSDPQSGERPDLTVFNEGFTVVFAGNVGSAQAVKVIVEAAIQLAAHPEIKIVVFGSGSELRWMEQRVHDNALCNLHLLGRFSELAMPYLLSRASALLVTLADRPIFALTVPNKIQAYMAVGRPIIACLNGEGARLIREADAGLAVPAEDAAELAKAILTLSQAPLDRLERFGVNAKNYYQEHFDQDKIVDKLFAHLNTVSQGKV